MPVRVIPVTSPCRPKLRSSEDVLASRVPRSDRVLAVREALRSIGVGRRLPAS